MSNNQLSVNSLLSAADLSKSDIEIIFEKAKNYSEQYKPGDKFSDLKGVTVAMAFFEPSTRTKLSFDIAAKRLSADTLAFSSSTSSLTKGESLLDTLHTIEAMGVDMFVVRHSKSGVPKFLQDNTKGVVLNAGDGKHAHPTQALLDGFTLWRQVEKIEELKVAIVGDVLHSRVARSNIDLFTTLGAEVKLCGPGTLVPNHTDIWGVDIIESIDDAIDWADVLIMLRLQRERMDTGVLPSIREYSNYYGLNLDRFNKKPELVVMHPGPVNYGIELDYRISSFPNCLIETQVTNGVFIRMALLSLLSPKN